MQNLYEDLKQLLGKDERLTSEDGKLLKNRVIELGLKLDSDLLRLLLSHERIKEHFFAQVDGVLVFDKDEFLQFVNNKQFLPDSYTAFKNKIGLSDDGGDTYLSRRRDVALVWPYKDCVLEGGQTEEDAKRDEIFWNTTLAPDDIDRLLDPKVLTNFRRVNAEGERPARELKPTDNLIIKSNNLLALHSLRRRLGGQVKLIYIDPPYNTDNDDFNYNDSFTESSWLTFMRNRLEVAKSLLHPSGAIFVQISDIGVSRLRILLDGVFGAENFINKITVKTRSPSGFKVVNLGVFESAEYILVYGKKKEYWEYHHQYVETDYDENYNKIILNIDDPPEKWEYENLREVVTGTLGYEDVSNARKALGKRAFDEKISDYALENADRVFRFTTINTDAGQDTLDIKALSQEAPDSVFIVEREDYPNRFILNGQEITFYAKKVRQIDGEPRPTTYLTNIWTDIPWEGIASEGNVKLKQGKKPEKLLRRIIDMSTNPGDIVVDFFLGSGTTAAVAHKMQRQYVGIEQLNYGENDSIVRLKNVIKGDQTGVSELVDWSGGGHFVACKLMEWNERYVDRIQTAASADELWELWQEMQEEAFLSYKVDVTTVNEEAEAFADLTLEEQKRFLLETLDHNTLYVNFSEIDDADYGVSEEDKRLNVQFYGQEV